MGRLGEVAEDGVGKATSQFANNWVAFKYSVDDFLYFLMFPLVAGFKGLGILHVRDERCPPPEFFRMFLMFLLVLII